MHTFPLRHISVRVPWHDTAWNGSVCACPGQNTSCLKLSNIAETKDEKAEALIAGKSLKDLSSDQFPPCVKERGTFMADFPLTREHEHPYAKQGNSTHAHFLPTALYYPAHSAAGLPFRWLMKKFVLSDPEKGVTGLIDQFPIEGVSQEYEPDEDTLGFPSRWFQDHRNQRALLDCFWNHVRVEESLVFFYAKQVPLVEDIGRRVIVGVGRIKKLRDLTEYSYKELNPDSLRSLLWERMVEHSILPDHSDGFLMPYHEALLKSDDGRSFDPADIVAFAPEDRFQEFSYATEHVTHDAAISSLLSCRAALLRCAELFSYDISIQERWIDRELGRLWTKRGPFPGVGAVLSASGIAMGNFVAQALVNHAGDAGNPWHIWDKALMEPEKYLGADLARRVDSTIASAWQDMDGGRRSFLELLSRVDLTQDQANILVVEEERQEIGITLTDADFTSNPYLLYEATRLTNFPVAIGTVDRGMFPTEQVRRLHPLPPASRVETAVDARRLRALVIRELETAASNGDTLLARSTVITEIRRREDALGGEARTPVNADLLAVAERKYFPGEIELVEMADSSRAYQLERLAKVADRIRQMVTKRIGGKRHLLKVDWRSELDNHLGDLPTDPDEKIAEGRARTEKAAALAEIAASRLSVLIGPAGTGKTTLLSVLSQRTEIHENGILLLAPTGKARVRMESIARKTEITNYEAHTLAQFLGRCGRYDSSTRRYKLNQSAPPAESAAKTVIVDECSMLTEEMLAALIDSLPNVQRLILVGDHRQLPPIGAGRPFVDIVGRLLPSNVETSFPRVAPSYAELTVPRRQGAGNRDDLQLAAWFGGGANGPGEDQVFEILSGKRKGKHIQFFSWHTPSDLQQLLPKVIAETLEFSSEYEEWQAFAESLGAVIDGNGYAWFNSTYGDRDGAGKQAESWQVLTPVRQKPWGVDPLNQFIHERYKGEAVREARNQKGYRKIPLPMGEHQIIYGDKVINDRNRPVPSWEIFPKPATWGYLANGEIGMVVGHHRTKKRNWVPKELEVEFSTQTGQVFKFEDSDFGEEKDASLDLAYALTVHRAQGSEFEVVFLILPRSPLMLSRELLYTALTRQKKRVVVLHQGSATELQRLSMEEYSASAKRLTNLFKAPKPIKVGNRFLEERLIHVTTRGDTVRSKSEVIIANLFHARGVTYQYEQPLEIDGVVKYPDFTIEDRESGITYLWEHCGMLHDPEYRKRWTEKLAWYRKNNILPHTEGGGERATLIISEDQPDGGIHSPTIDQLLSLITG